MVPLEPSNTQFDHDLSIHGRTPLYVSNDLRHHSSYILDPLTPVFKRVRVPISPRFRTATILLALFTTSAIAFGQVFHFDFVNLDDTFYITENFRVQGGLTWESIAWVIQETNLPTYHPVTMLSHMLDCSFFGLEAGWHHLSSLAIHILASWLLYIALVNLTESIWHSAFVAGLFAIHPLHVESVAWISERKDVLSGAFFAALLWAYSAAVRDPKSLRKIYVLALFALGLLSKPMLVTTPFVLLLLDFWPLKRMKTRSQLFSLIKEKIPLFVMATAAATVTIATQESGNAVRTLSRIDPVARVTNSLSGYGHYIFKSLWPNNLAAYYPLPDTPPITAAVVALIAILVISTIALRETKKRPYLIVGWLWFLGMLVPVIGLIQVGSQAYADRYSYLPSIGLFIMIAWSVPSLLPNRSWKPKVLVGGAATTLLLLTALAHRQTGYWRNSVSLFTRAVEVNKGHSSIRMMLADAHNHEKQFKQAEPIVRKVLVKRPLYPWANFVLAESLNGQERFMEALPHSIIAAESIRSFAPAQTQACTALAGSNKIDNALQYCRRALEHDPDYAPAHVAWAKILVAQGRIAEARSHHEEAMRLRPYSEKLQSDLPTIDPGARSE